MAIAVFARTETGIEVALVVYIFSVTLPVDGFSCISIPDSKTNKKLVREQK